MINFHEISITGLFGRVNVTLPIKDNRVIIVGNNGIGKSTILNAFYYFVSYQWEKLGEIHFDSIEVHAEGQTGHEQLVVTKGNLPDIEFHRQLLLFESRSRKSLSRNFSRIVSNLTKREIYELSSTKTLSSMMRYMSSKYGVPLSVIRELRSMFRHENLDAREISSPDIEKIESFFDENLNGQILYLPTYRRIEKDIKSIFPEIEYEIQQATGPRRNKGFGNQNDLYVELVNFGMEDVNRMIEEKMESLRYRALNEIQELSTRYLRDVIRDEVNASGTSRVQSIDDSNLERIFANVDESLLNREDQRKIYDVAHKIKSNEKIKENEKYVAHYISSLIDISEKMTEREKPIKEFIRICESYLFEKKINFDNAGYSLTIECDDENSMEVKMENLSSGEKQIVSLFAKLILDNGPKNYYIIIDEPELSLSVDWQEKFLPDISNLKSCAFIGAVTHSPFVFDNDLDDYAVDMLSCITR